MKKIPLALIGLRALIGICILLLTVFYTGVSRQWLVTLLVIGLLTDVFDGIIARRLKISTLLLRRLDSITDQFFWLCSITSCYILCSAFFKANAIEMYLLIAAESITYIISFVKFHKEVATHAIASKIWALSILATLIQVMLSCYSGILFNVCFYLGIITRAEIILILLILKKWTSDVPSVYHAVLLRRGEQIKRNKLFNG